MPPPTTPPHAVVIVGNAPPSPPRAAPAGRRPYNTLRFRCAERERVEMVSSLLSLSTPSRRGDDVLALHRPPYELAVEQASHLRHDFRRGQTGLLGDITAAGRRVHRRQGG